MTEAAVLVRFLLVRWAILHSHTKSDGVFVVLASIR